MYSLVSAIVVSGQLLQVQRILRERVWAAAHVRLNSITLDTDTTVHTLYGKQMGARKSYNPKNKGKKSYQPILTFKVERGQKAPERALPWQLQHFQNASQHGIFGHKPDMVQARESHVTSL
jgi:hypothetical protein